MRIMGFYSLLYFIIIIIIVNTDPDTVIFCAPLGLSLHFLLFYEGFLRKFLHVTLYMFKIRAEFKIKGWVEGYWR